jgi:hypothetical protein
MIRFFRLVAFVALLFCASPVRAQQIPGWTMDVRLGKPLFVTLTNGNRIEGVAGSVTTDGVTVATPVGVMTVKFADIGRVQRRDSVWNGVWIGAATGAGLGIITVAADANDDDYYASAGEERAAVVIGGALYGALIGWGVDALLKGRTTIFDAAGATRVSLAVGPRSVGGRFSVTW